MSEKANEVKKEERKPKKVKEEKLKGKEKKAKKEVLTTKNATDDKKFRPKAENESIQNKVIENIKNFISKIIEMQEKVRRDEEEEKKLKKGKEIESEENEKVQKPKYLLEYYDLPFRYNETVVKILAQTPKRLFVYWDVADKDKQTYLNAFGNSFFEDTYPVLLIHNENKNYTSEIPINDFANSWYIEISDSRDRYTIQLGRKFRNHIKPQINTEIEQTNIALNNDYLLIAVSNQLEVPNDHILFEEFKPSVTYRNVKTHQEEIKNLETSIYKQELKTMYQEFYEDKIEGEEIDMLNPSSIGVSSMSFR